MRGEFILKIPIFVFLFKNIKIISLIVMRGLRILYILVCVFLSPVTIVNLAKAQMPQRGGNQVAIMGWTDDSHYQIRNFDSNKNIVIQSVDIKTGKAVVLPPSK